LRHPLDQAENHVPGSIWDPVVDYQMMSRNVRGTLPPSALVRLEQARWAESVVDLSCAGLVSAGFMSLFHSDKPVITKVHGFAVAGGTDLALCSDMIVIEDAARIGYPPGRGAYLILHKGMPSEELKGFACRG